MSERLEHTRLGLVTGHYLNIGSHDGTTLSQLAKYVNRVFSLGMESVRLLGKDVRNTLKEAEEG
jgi:hypothetical protein